MHLPARLPRTTAVAALAMAMAAVLLGACSGSPDATASNTGGAASAGSSASTVAPSGTPSSCAWPVKADQATLNVAYPDTAATYWVQRYSLAPGERLELGWTPPEARYSSFITYAPSGGVLDVRTDRDLTVGPDGTATVVLAADVEPGAGGNTIAATGTPRNSVGTAIDNTAGPGASAAAGTTQPGGRVDGTVIYRVYVPDDAADPAGGVPLPTITTVAADGARAVLPPCPSPGASPDAVDVVNRFGPETTTPAPAQPIFIRPASGGGNLYPNPDNVYVATIVDHRPGEVVVVRGKAPSFPDTRAGEPITGEEQVRYWSLCTNEYRKPYPVTGCVHDAQVALDADGWYTFVVSTPEDRPANADAANGVTWLDWGSTEVDGLLLLRHMLASPSFPQSATNLAPGALATSTMGEYAPRGAYCRRATFETGGAAACGL